MYNGYENYETWHTMLVFDNEESLYNYSRDLVKEAKAKEPDERDAIHLIAKTLEQTVENMRPETNNLIWSALMNSAQENIDFYEIAENLYRE